MPGNDKMSKPDFDDSYRSGATHLDLSISDRSAFDGDDFFGGRSKLTRSCLLVKTQQDSLKQMPSTSDLRSSLRSSTSSTVSFDKVTLRSYDGEFVVLKLVRITWKRFTHLMYTCLNLL